MKRFLIAAILVLGLISALPAGAGTSAPGRHWRHSTGQQTVVVWSFGSGLTWANKKAIYLAAYRWSAHSRVNVKVRGCLAGENCVSWYGERRNGGIAYTSWSSDNHLLSGTVKVDNSPGQLWANQVHVACHEGAHELGLHHGTEPGPCRSGYPTADDFGNLTLMYHAAPDSTGPAGDP